MKLQLYNRIGEKTGVFIFDEESLPLVMQGKEWRVATNGYVVDRHSRYFHTMLMGKEKGFIIDHKNHNPLDNRLSNLRFVTKSQNGMNKPAAGITYNKRLGKWEAYIHVPNKPKSKKIHLGFFKSERFAKAIRIAAEKEYFKEYAYNAL